MQKVALSKELGATTYPGRGIGWKEGGNCLFYYGKKRKQP